MFASGLTILSALFVLQAEVQFEAGTRIESSIGEAPTGTTQVTSSSAAGSPVTTSVPAEQPQVVVAATPLLSLRWLDGVDDLRVESASRILWRPEPLPDSRPLFLETLEATHTRHPSRRSRLRLNFLASYGEQDYTSLQQQLSNQPALPLATTMLMLDATGGASWRSSRRTTLDIQLGAMYRRAFDTSTLVNGTAGSSASTVPTLPTQYTLTAAPGLAFALTRRSSVDAVVSVIDTDSQEVELASGQPGDLNVLLIQPQVGIREELTGRQQLHLAAGFSYAVTLRRTDIANLTWYPAPLLQIDLISVLQRTRTAVVRSTLGAGTTEFVDPVLGAVVSRGLAQAGVDAQLGLWSVGARCAFATDLSRTLPTIGNVFPDETAVSAEIPVRYRTSRHLVVELGGRYTERAPHLGAPGFAWHNRELWLYLNLTASSRPSSTRS